MPLLDHFNPPLNRTHPWRSFHGAWAAAMARLLNQGILPSGYYAVPLVEREGPIEIDVAALAEPGAPVPASGTAGTQTVARNPLSRNSCSSPSASLNSTTPMPVAPTAAYAARSSAKLPCSVVNSEIENCGARSMGRGN